MTGSRWHDRGVLRVSVSNWSTDEADVEESVDAVRRAAPVGSRYRLGGTAQTNLIPRVDVADPRTTPCDS